MARYHAQIPEMTVVPAQQVDKPARPRRVTPTVELVDAAPSEEVRGDFRDGAVSGDVGCVSDVIQPFGVGGSLVVMGLKFGVEGLTLEGLG